MGPGCPGGTGRTLREGWAPIGVPLPPEAAICKGEQQSTERGTGMASLIELHHTGDTVWTAGPDGVLRGWRVEEDGALHELAEAFEEMRRVAAL